MKTLRLGGLFLAALLFSACQGAEGPYSSLNGFTGFKTLFQVEREASPSERQLLLDSLDEHGELRTYEAINAETFSAVGADYSLSANRAGATCESADTYSEMKGTYVRFLNDVSFEDRHLLMLSSNTRVEERREFRERTWTGSLDEGVNITKNVLVTTDGVDGEIATTSTPAEGGANHVWSANSLSFLENFVPAFAPDAIKFGVGMRNDVPGIIVYATSTEINPETCDNGCHISVQHTKILEFRFAQAKLSDNDVYIPEEGHFYMSREMLTAPRYSLEEDPSYLDKPVLLSAYECLYRAAIEEQPNWSGALDPDGHPEEAAA